MFRLVSKKESIQKSKAAFNKMKEGSLFDDGDGKYFLVIGKFKDLAMVAELSDRNRQRLIKGEHLLQRSIGPKDQLVVNLLLV